MSKQRRISRYSALEAADSGRLFEDWVSKAFSANGSVLPGLRKVRGRSREITENNDYCRGAVQTILNNILGETGITYQAKVLQLRGGGFNERTNTQIESIWAEWSEDSKSCDTAGRLSLTEIEHLLLRTIIVDGEVLVRLVPQRFGDSIVPLALELIDVDQLADMAWAGMHRGNSLGIEFDQWKRPLKYWIYPNIPEENWIFNSVPTKPPNPVEASEILHLYSMERIGRIRGVPWLAASLKRMHHLGRYEDAEIVKARAQAGVMGFIKSPLPDSFGPAEDASEEDKANQVIEFEPGTILTLSPGEEFEGFDPTAPNTGTGDFLKYMLRGFSTGLGVGYAPISHDYSEANYSSERSSKLEEHAYYRFIQNWLVKQFREPLYRAWMHAAVLSGAIVLPGFEERPRFYLAAKFTAPTFDWVDPQKDIAACKEALKSGMTTLTRELAKRGLDFEETIQQLQDEKAAIEKAGLTLDYLMTEGGSAPPESAKGEDAEIAAGLQKIERSLLGLVDRIAQLEQGATRAELQLFREDTANLRRYMKAIGVGLTPVNGWQGQIRAKNCKTGKPCKGTCISKNKTCLDGLTADQEKLAKKARTAMAAGKIGPAVDLPAAAPAAPVAPVQTPVAPPRALATNTKELTAKRSKLVADHGQQRVDAAEANVKKLLADADIYIQVGNSDTLNLVLGGGFKTAHELNGRPGSDKKYLDARARVEEKVLGLDKKTAPGDRPIYGFFGSKDLNSGEHLDPQGSYGQISVKLKPQVKDNATFTGSDSFKSGIASKVDDPSAASLLSLTSRGHDRTDISKTDYRDALDQAGKARNLAELSRAVVPHGGKYIEAQVQQKLTADDIAELHFKPSGRHNDITPEIAKTAKAKGIKLFVNGKEVDPDTITNAPAKPRTKLDDLQDALSSKDPAKLKAWQDDFKQEVAATTLNPRERDRALKTVFKAAGYDAKPEVVSKAEIDQDLQDGRFLMGRVVNDSGTKKAQDVVKQFRTGDLHVGQGIYGDGTYVAIGAKRNRTTLEQNEILTPLNLAQANNAVRQSIAQYDAGNGRYKRMTLASDAKIITRKELDKIRGEHLDQLRQVTDAEKARVLKGAKRHTKKEEDAFLAQYPDVFRNMQVTKDYDFKMTDVGDWIASANYKVQVEGPKGGIKKGEITINTHKSGSGYRFEVNTISATKMGVPFSTQEFSDRKEAEAHVRRLTMEAAMKQKKQRIFPSEVKVAGELTENARDKVRQVDLDFKATRDLLDNNSVMATLAGADIFLASDDSKGYAAQYAVLLNRGKVRIQDGVVKKSDFK
jgi:lambda family phage portal protein